MAEKLFEFEEGPYDILNYDLTAKDGKVILSLNDGDLGRIPIENMATVRKLREALEKAEAHFKEIQRRKEEL